MRRRVFNQVVASSLAGISGSSLTTGCDVENGGSRPPAKSPEPLSKAQLGVTPASGPPRVESSEGVSAARANARGSATDPVVLGRSGLVVPRLAMGTGSAGWRRESDQTRLGREGFVRLMKAGAERGAKFIDTADLYGAHDFVRSALQELRRDEVTLLSKVWFKSNTPNMSPTETARPEVERFLREMNVEKIDIMLVHAVTDPAWPKQNARMRDELSELKQQGKVRAVGCSCHSHAALRVAAEDPWVDVILARINPGRKNMDEDASIDEVAATLRLARANGKGVVGMKIYGAGQWSGPEQRKQSLHHALDNGLVDAMTIGHLSEAQLDDTIANIDSVLAAG